MGVVQEEVRLVLLRGALDDEEEGPELRVLLWTSEVLLARLHKVSPQAPVEGQGFAAQGARGASR